MKKQRLFPLAVLLMALAFPSVANAYDFSAVSPSGHTLYYNAVNAYSVTVTYQQFPGESYDDIYSLNPAYSNLIGDLVIPDSVTYNGTTYCVRDIGDSAFSYCSNLTSVTLPNSILVIGLYAFAHCSSLTLTVPSSCIYIEEYAFLGVLHIEYDGTATGAPWGAQYMNSKEGDFIYSNTDKDTLVRYVGSSRNVTIPSTVKVILDRAFYGNSTLTEITIPSQVEQIGMASEPWGDAPQAFRSCTALTTVNFNATNCRNAAEEASPFRDCPLFTTLNIGEGVTLIDHAMFMNCTAISSLVIPNSVSRIRHFAFDNCVGIPSIHIPRSVTDIDVDAFWGCRFTSMSVDSENPVYDSRDNCNAIIHTSTNTLLRGCANTMIPNSVHRIGGRAFRGCTNLTSITIPESVTVIEHAAFDECTSLASVSMGNDLDSIEAFAFYDCSSLTSITIPKSVTYVGRNAFSGCSSLDTLHFNAADCYMHVLPEDDGEGSSWMHSMFGDCGEFVLTVGEDVTKIPDFMFYDEALRWDDNGNPIVGPTFTLTAIVSYATVPPAVGRDAFYLTDRQIPLTVPCSAEEAYRADSAWSEFTNIQCMEVGIDEVAEEDGIHVWSAEGRIFVEDTEGREAFVYDVMGRRVAAVAAGRDACVPVPAGVYLVHVEGLPARKVVVIN